jgi:hypothetical protein
MAVAVGRGTGVSEGTAATSGCEVGIENPQAVMSNGKIKRKDARAANLLNGFMGMSFCWENMGQLYKQTGAVAF